ncbi:ATP-binding protein [Roseateles asaccharophilus]|uniref:histidine kinase n=1 Tax=Roseateles asaccharophilus TaxID=582607 RepID=A0ABU2A5E0_9BURK|nr:ATP-binding protein [Roseateles asaccharophilus]MDR7332414.1 signal transduction histidine kinase/CheY-like chemotaxis protein [Roseateles asaccharophilus]
MSLPTLVLLGPVGTRWLFGLIVVSALAAWGSETLLGVIEPSDRVAYPCIGAAFTVLGLLSWRQPQRLHLWQRCGVTMLALYFCVSLLAFTLRGDPGPSLYTLGSIAPWSLGGLLLLFTTWQARQALQISLALLALMVVPPTLLRFSGQSPAWLLTAWPLIANLALCQTMFCLALWGLSRQLAPLQQLAPQGDGLATASDLVRARMAELERSRAAAQAASRAKSDFLASIGHEIRTPMSTVLGQTRLLLAGRLTAEQRRQLEDVAHAGEALVRLIDGLLDYADLDAGRLQLASEPLHLEQLLAGAVDAVRLPAQAQQLELLCDIVSPELLGAGGARRGDAARLTQLLTELLVNAVKFTPAGQVRLSAQLEADGGWRFSVRDSGVGMTTDQLSRLFMPFVQAESGATRRFGGTGLGLAICRALAERMGGTLTARSMAGRGSEFELRLPLPPAPWPGWPAATPPRSIALVQAPHSPGHEAMLGLLRDLAPQARQDLLPHGAAALQRLATHPPELLLVDWVLPDMDGCALLERAAQAGLARPRRTVLLSAFDTPALRERALRLGADALHAKPLLPHTLRRLLDLQQPLPEASPAPLPADGPSTDPATLISELDSLLGEADSHALTLWEQHGSAFIDLLPGPQAKALAGAMQRVDFDEAQAALRGEKGEKK